MKKKITIALLLVSTLVNAQFSPTFKWTKTFKSEPLIPSENPNVTKVDQDVAGIDVDVQRGNLYAAINASYTEGIGVAGVSKKTINKIVKYAGNGSGILIEKSYQDHDNSSSFANTYISLSDLAYSSNNDNVYAAGNFYGTVNLAFTTSSSATITSNTTSGNSIFLAKYNANTLAHVWSKKINFTTVASGNFSVKKIKVSKTGNIYVIGTVNTSSDVYTTYLAKYTSSGTLSWKKAIKSLSNTGSIYISDLALDESGNAYIVGSGFGGVNFGDGFTLSGGVNGGNANELNTYFAKYSSAGSVVFANKVTSNHTPTEIQKVVIDGTVAHFFTEHSKFTFISGRPSVTPVTEKKGDILWIRYKSADGTYINSENIEPNDAQNKAYKLNDVGVDQGRNAYVSYGTDKNDVVFAKYKRNTTSGFYAATGTMVSTLYSNIPNNTNKFTKAKMVITKNGASGYSLYMAANINQRLKLPTASTVALSEASTIKGYESIFAQWSKTSTSGRLNANEDEESDDEIIAEETITTSLVNAAEVTVFPNPTTESIQVTLSNADEKASLTVINIEGRIVKTITNYENNATVDLSELTTGLYIVTIQQGNSVTRKQVLKN